MTVESGAHAQHSRTTLKEQPTQTVNVCNIAPGNRKSAKKKKNTEKHLENKKKQKVKRKKLDETFEKDVDRDKKF